MGVGESVQGRGGVHGGGGLPPLPDVPSTQQIEKMLENDPFSTWKYHSVGRKQINIIIVGQFRAPSANQQAPQLTNKQQTQESGTLHITSH